MKKHLKTYKHHYLRLGLLITGLAVSYLLSLFVLAITKDGGVSYAATYDSTVRLIITGDYSGSVTATTNGHQLGTCLSSFTISSSSYKYCEGSAMGSPDGMSLAAAAPSGYTKRFVITYNSANGSASCNATCWFNFTSGTVYIELQINRDTPPPTPPTAPTAYLDGVTSSSMSVSWSSGSAGSYTYYDYLPYFNGGSNGTTQSRYATYSGLKCNTRYSFYVSIRTSGGNYASNTVYATTSACPAPTPTPTPTPSPTPTPTSPSSGGSSGSGSSSPPKSSGGSSTPIQGSGSSGGSSGSVSVTNNSDASAELTQSPPAAPQGFTAQASEGSSAISLDWQSGNADSPLHFVLERSSNKKEWMLLSDAITAQSYTDTTTLFSTQYYYRLTAVDENGLKSPAVITDVKSGAFKANAGTGEDITITSEDGIVRVTIPSTALVKPANCSFVDNPVLPLTGEKSYEVASGPYQIICQHEDATIAQRFEKPLAVQIRLTQAMQKSYKHIKYQAYGSEADAWAVLGVKDKQTSFQLKGDQTALIILGQPKHTPGWIIALIVLVILAGGGVVGMVFVSRLIQRRRAEAAVEDYWHKMNGV